jgi:hypothetical protein
LRFLPFFDEFELELDDEFELELLEEFELELLEEFELELLELFELEFAAATATGPSDRPASAAEAVGAVAPTATISPVAPSLVAYVLHRRSAPSADDMTTSRGSLTAGTFPARRETHVRRS